MANEAAEIRTLFKQLVQSERIPFPQNGKPSVAPVEHGVYIIYSPNDDVLHVGRTLRGKHGLRQRLNDHLHGKNQTENR